MLRAGIFRYRRTSAHGRGATIEPLSDDDARMSTFMREYFCVLRQSIHGIVSRRAGGGSLRARAHSLADLARESLHLLNRLGGVFMGMSR